MKMYTMQLSTNSYFGIELAIKLHHVADHTVKGDYM